MSDSPNVVGESNAEENSAKIINANTQVSRLSKAFTNGLSANVKLSKSQLSKIVQLERFL